MTQPTFKKFRQISTSLEPTRQIDDEIELKVLKIRGNQVHLGIDAPKKAAVHRKEVWLRIGGEPQAAAAK